VDLKDTRMVLLSDSGPVVSFAPDFFGLADYILSSRSVPLSLGSVRSKYLELYAVCNRAGRRLSGQLSFGEPNYAGGIWVDVSDSTEKVSLHFPAFPDRLDIIRKGHVMLRVYDRGFSGPCGASLYSALKSGTGWEDGLRGCLSSLTETLLAVRNAFHDICANPDDDVKFIFLAYGL